MAVLGIGGKLELRRQPPAPLRVNIATFNPASDTIAPVIDCNWQHWWTGDDATIVFYDVNNTPIGFANVFICVDELSRISFYKTKCTSMACKRSDRIDLTQLSFAEDIDHIGIFPSGDEPYENSRVFCSVEGQGNYEYYDVFDDDPLNVDIPVANRDSMCNYAPTYEYPIAGTDDYGNADIQPRPDIGAGDDGIGKYLCVADIREWSLELDAPAVDTTGVGQKFGEAVKSLITAGGTIDFLVDRACHPELEEPEVLMQLLLMTKQGAKASAKFYLVNDPTGSCEDIAGSLYYETDILITRNAINLRPTEIVACTATFVTTGEVKLLMHGA